jgi:hypothetical protein
LKSAQDLLQKIIYPNYDQFKETAKIFMEESDRDFFYSLGSRWDPFYCKKIQRNVSKIINQHFEEFVINFLKNL